MTPTKATKKAKCPKLFTGQAYQATFEILYKNRAKGISRDQLLKELKKKCDKEERLLLYDISVITSSKKTGESHKSIHRKADHYYIEKSETGAFYKLHMR